MAGSRSTVSPRSVQWAWPLLYWNHRKTRRRYCTSEQEDSETIYDVVSASLRDVRIERLDHSMDDLIERGRAVATVAGAMLANISRAQYERRRR